jgi:hypothetical protein
MKVNLKKIGAIVAGATILASSAAFGAGLMFGSTTLVDSNGAPVAKVVIGEDAASSDGVAAALIAGTMVSEMWTSQTLTASVVGSATCAAESQDGTGDCAISNEKAQLEITVPGTVAAGTWTGDNLIGDYLNRELLDREDNLDPGDSDQAYEMGGSDTSENANPFTDGMAGSLGPNEEFLFRIDGDMFSPFEDEPMTDEDAGNSYVEMQDLWIDGNNHFDEDEEEVIGEVEFLAYTLKFDGPGGDEVGIPVCTDSEDGDYSFCKGADGDIDDATETHRVEMMFLGEPWIISEMEAPNHDDPHDDTTDIGGADDGLVNENDLVNGGMIKLAKESVSGILNQGESLPVGDLKFQLDDLEAHGEVTSAIISIIDANGNVLEKDKVLPGQTKEFVISGETYRFHVYKVAPGYTFGAKWADVAIFSHELELEDGEELDADEDSNPDYEVVLGWKNLDASGGEAIVDGGNPEAADALRMIGIFSEDVEDLSTSGEEELGEGDSIPIVQDPTAWNLYYMGLDLTSEDRFSLEFDLQTNDHDEISQGKGPVYGGDQVATLIRAPYLEVTSGESGSVFETDRDDGAGGGQLSDHEFIVALNGWAYDDDDDLTTGNDPVTGEVGYDVTAPGGLDGVGDVFMHLSQSSEDYGVNQYDAGDGMVLVQYDDIGDGDHEFSPPEGGAIVIQTSVDASGGNDLIGDMLISDGWGSTFVGYPDAPDFMIGVAEKAGTGSSNEFVDYYVFGVSDQAGTSSPDMDPDSTTFDFDSGDAGMQVTSDDEEVLYCHATPSPATAADVYYDDYDVVGPVEKGCELVEEGYVSERGSVFEMLDDDTVEFEMAHKLARAQWLLSSAESTAGTSATHVVWLGEGEDTQVGGVTVKVVEITEDVGACSAAGGAVSCVADMTGVSAVIMPNNAASVDVQTPYTGTYGNLVILDSDAVGVNTLVSVGGDVVNTVTADLLQGSAVDWTAETKVVKEVVEGSKIVVAGKTGPDTLEAANDFVQQVQRV